MLTRTYISKINTIIKDSDLNTGLNPVSELLYGKHTSRMLLYFDHTNLKKLVCDKVFPDMSKLTHILKITNAGSIDFTQVHCNEISSLDETTKIRTSSFDLIVFLIPNEWDGGKGYDYTYSFFNQGYYGANCGQNGQDTARLISSEGCNWFQRRNGLEWAENCVYSNDTLSNEYEKFSATEKSEIVIARQRFDIGNENISIDITEVVNKFISGELENYGLGIAYAPMLERTEDEVEHYVGFLTHKTSSFFMPYIETRYDDYIDDDRSNFILGKQNKLYLYCNIDGELVNLDEIPTCEVNGTSYEVKQFSKGIYYIDITLSKNDFKAPTMLYDVWGNIKYQGEEIDDVELDFVVKNGGYFNIGKTIEESTKLVPVIYGINENERIQRGDVRKVGINPRIEYNKSDSMITSKMEARVYVKDGQRELDVIPFHRINKTDTECYFIIDTNILLPQKYYIDIKVIYNQEEIVHHNTLSFFITDNLNNKYN